LKTKHLQYSKPGEAAFFGKVNMQPSKFTLLLAARHELRELPKIKRGELNTMREARSKNKSPKTRHEFSRIFTN